MSNDQSPPARKVIPYKKGGQRRSPFADMALQFSGTALDIAIQQRESESVPEGADEDQPEPVAASTQDLPAEPSAEADSVELPESEKSLTPPVIEAPEPEVPTVIRTGDVRKAPEKRRVGLAPVRNKVPVPATASLLKSFVSRWEPFLTETQIGICAYIYNNSTAVGQEFCFTSTAKLMAAVSKTERQVKTVLSQLTDWGFLIKGETVVNAPREQRGTFYKLAVTKS